MAIRESKPTAIDNRIRVMVYNPDDVFKYTGYYGYQANIEFADGETVDSISMGDTVSWQIVPSGKRIFLKPIEDDATTNMTLITNKRTYYFELHAEEAEDINDPNMVFTVRFLYPDETNGSVVRSFTSNSEPDLSEPENYNFDYTISGNDTIAPLKIFDDGEFTYFQFKDKNAAIPAFFIVDTEGHEEIVNYRMAGKYIAVERVVSRFTLRHGKDSVCVFNEAIDFEDPD
jgi:type IV secretion system protein VirB9